MSQHQQAVRRMAHVARMHHAKEADGEKQGATNMVRGVTFWGVGEIAPHANPPPPGSLQLDVS